MAEPAKKRERRAEGDMKRHCPALLEDIKGLLDLIWYERDKSQEGPPTFWRAIWPEGGKPRQGRVNFVAMLYLSAPTKAAALREFQRWAESRMADIPFVVLEQVNIEEIPCCPYPCSKSNGEAMAGMWSQLT
jgi:hypothetical protein